MKSRTSDLQIPRSDAQPLKHRDSMNMLGLKTNKVQSISSVSLAGLPKDVRIPTSGNHRRTSKGSLSGSLAGFEQLENQHDLNVAREDTGDQWTPERCTRQMQTDAYGEIDFLGTGSQNKRSPYVRVSHDTDVQLILKLMLERWNLEIPNLVISVTGGAKSFVLKPRLKEVFRRGLIKAAKSTSAWIITGGTNAGVMKHVGEAVREQEITFGSEDKVNVIGIATWGIVDRKDSLKASKDTNGLYPAHYRMEQVPGSSGALLDSNHSHFLLVDNGTEGKYGVEINLRSRFEEAVMKVKTDSRSAAGAIGVPVVLLVLEGGPNTVRTMCELIKKKIPAVVIDGSGRAADVVAYAYSHTTKSDGKFIVDPQYEGKIRAKVADVFQFRKEQEVDEHYKMIEEVLEDDKMISIYRMDDETNISQDIDLAILKALLKANSSAPLMQLNLALAWNRIDVAKSEIFTDDKLWTTEALTNPMLAALLDDKPGFVELFLQNGLSMREFLTPQILCQLYAGVPSNSVIKPLVQKEMNKKNITALNLRVIGEVIEELMGDSYHSLYLRDPRYMTSLPEERGKSRKITQPVIVCNPLHRIDPLKTPDFEQHAIGVLQECYEENETLSQTLLVKELDNFGNLTALDLAVMAEDQNFIAHTSCQVLLTRLWMGAMAMNTKWWKLQEDHSMEHMMRSTDMTFYDRITSFYSAPFTKFMGNLVSYIAFILLYGYVITMYFPKFDSSKTLGGLSVVEFVLYFWILTIIMEEIRQLAAQQPKTLGDKLSVYFSDTWNLVDTFALLAFVVAACLRFFDSTYEAARIIFSLNIIVFIVRSLQIVSVNRQLGPKLVMIRKMLEDLKQFVIILAIFIIAYGIALQAVSFPGPGQFAKTWDQVIRGILDLPYWQMYGELFLEEISGQKPSEYFEVHPTAKWLSPALLAGYMLFTNVLLLNLLIAIFSYTFERVQEDSDKVWKFQRYELIAEYHGRPLFFPPLIFISHVLISIRWIWRLCRCGNPPSVSSMSTYLPIEIKLTDYEKEQLENWEFQGAEYFLHTKRTEEKNTLEKRVCTLGDRVNDATVKLDRIMECVMDTSAVDSESAPGVAQPNIDFRPPTRDTGALERRLARMEDNVTSILKTMKTLVDLAHKTAPANILDLRPVAPAFIHHKARATPYPQSTVKRFQVPDDNVPWEVDLPDYSPVNYTAPIVLKKPPWADYDLMSMHPSARPALAYNRLDDEYKVNRASHMGPYRVKDGLPLNPMGRTGVVGRGLLGRFGPNHAADPIVTRWKRTSGGVMLDGGKKVLEFVAIQRRDNSQWAIPGGMVEPGQVVTQVLKAEFGEEAMAKLSVTDAEREKISRQIDRLFHNGVEVYKGYVDDPRNTDNAWMETVAVNFHDDTGEIFSEFKLQAGDDAAAVRWQRVSGNIPLFASHVSILEKVAKIRNAAF
ncbi:hypothetical protein pdam_00009856 [Pocillopora damicornis]|uniref:Nudix hydrolase domain-containing protein n=1 Tax=Pocillopora damicornis TaxID=46731 RepID=A0A3M6TLK6_POCDA|nr:hypothetical protein pdam_00009856 [Pocillopora damicornis]